MTRFDCSPKTIPLSLRLSCHGARRGARSCLANWCRPRHEQRSRTLQASPDALLPVYDPLDIAYVGTIMLEAAGLPLSASQQERKRLMMVCAGRYFGCEPRSEIL